MQFLKDIIHVLDADSIWHLINTKKIDNIDFSYSKFVLTPNNIEFKRLCDKFINKNEDPNTIKNDFDFDEVQNLFFDILYQELSKILFLKFKVWMMKFYIFIYSKKIIIL